MFFESEYTFGIKDIGTGNEITNKALLYAMEETACRHSDTVGYGVNNINEKKRVWVLLNWQVKVMKRPVYGDTVIVRTWSRGNDRISAFRDFEILDKAGEVMAAGTSRWVLIDIERHRPMRITEDIMSIYNGEDRCVFKEGLSEYNFNQDNLAEAQHFQYKLQRRDIDINGHMHNVNYLELAYEALPEDIFNNCCFNEIQIQYKKEIKGGQNVDCAYFTENGRHIVVMFSGDRENAVVVLSDNNKN